MAISGNLDRATATELVIENLQRQWSSVSR